ncbi:hypothetical protein ACFL27_08950 [candidate division CSSED10-310 bacterium]|uniref:RiboL-PSP-HEPN domain-containing protein n=1 Tax=candidate division CSSED10-310 bacterium TaxID=2855610 RepID=A0ABV6YVV4_UNCC1
MLDEDLIEEVETFFPYPIAVQVRRLGTQEYAQSSTKLLPGILGVAERVVHFLAYTVLINIYEAAISKPLPLPKGLTSDFELTLTRGISFGTLIRLLREGLRTFREEREALFIQELYNVFFDHKGAFTETMESFNNLVQIRNKVAHHAYSKIVSEITAICQEAEKNLEHILEEIMMLKKYEFLTINQIEVLKKRRKDPIYIHNFNRVRGHSDIFKVKREELVEPMDSYIDSRMGGDLLSPVIVIRKKKDDRFLNLFPLIMYSNEGENNIPDVFFLSKMNRKKAEYNYICSNQGGQLTSSATTFQPDISYEMDLFLKAIIGEESS